MSDNHEDKLKKKEARQEQTKQDNAAHEYTHTCHDGVSFFCGVLFAVVFMLSYPCPVLSFAVFVVLISYRACFSCRFVLCSVVLSCLFFCLLFTSSHLRPVHTPS